MNIAEKQDFIQHWDKVRRRGAILYVLGTALIWGTTLAFAGRFLMHFFGEGFNWAALRSDFTSHEFLLFWSAFLLGGLCYGLTMWFYFGWLCRSYQSEIKKNNPEGPTGQHEP